MILHKGLNEGGIRQTGKTETFLRRTAGLEVHTAILRWISAPFWLGTCVAAGGKESFCRNEVVRAKDESKICISILITWLTRHDFVVIGAENSTPINSS